MCSLHAATFLTPHSGGPIDVAAGRCLPVNSEPGWNVPRRAGIDGCGPVDTLGPKPLTFVDYSLGPLFVTQPYGDRPPRWMAADPG
jgi:hypothetical protein